MKKPSETLLYSTAGIAVLFVVLVAFNFLAGKVNKRIDLTSEKAYTLSPGTRAILAKLDTPVKIRFYYTHNENMPQQLKLYAQQIEDMLNDYRQASKGLVQIEKIDPEPDSDAEDSAKLDGVDPEPISATEQIYLGLSVSMLDQKEALPFLTPDRERLLEYDISSAITRVSTSKKPVVGLMSSLAVAGRQPSSMMMMQQQQSQPPWVFYNELARDFTVEQVAMDAPAIPDDVNVLVVIHPREIPMATQYAIDQFVLRGGKLLAFLDPCAVLDQPPEGMMMPQSSNSNLPELLKAWGLTFDSNQILIDTDYIARNGQGTRVPGVLSLSSDAFSKDDLVTADVSDMLMAFPGAFFGTPAAGLKETVLVKSSKDSQFANPMEAMKTPEQVLAGFVPSNKEFPLAIRLTGKFKTAFPDGPPKTEPDVKKDDATDAAKKDDKKPAPAPASLKESTGDNTVILVGDTDMLQDEFAVTEQQGPNGATLLVARDGNLAFAENAVEQLTGDSNLIAIRSRTPRERPFTVVEKMQLAAAASEGKKMQEEQRQRDETVAKLGELQQQRTDPDAKNSQQIIMTPEQKALIKKYKEEKVMQDKEIRNTDRDLHAKTNALENRIKWINIALMPALVAAAGVALALIKRKRSAAT